jgi:hypothetical protein
LTQLPERSFAGSMAAALVAVALFSSQKILQNFSDFSLHRIFRHMHEALNIDKK